MNTPTSQSAIPVPKTGNPLSDAMIVNMQNSDKTKVLARVFRSNVPSCNYVFKAGKIAAFINGKYTTDIAHEIAELDAEIAYGHPNFHTKEEEVVEVIEPLEALKARWLAELLDKQAADKAAGPADAGTSEQGKLNVVTTTTLAEGMAGSDSSSGNAPAAPLVVGLGINLKK